MRSSRRRWLTLPLVLALGAAGLLASEPDASAVNPPFTAWGTVQCTMSGTQTIKPGITFSAWSGVLAGFKAKLTCSTGTTGRSTVTIKRGRIVATGLASTLSCSSTTAPAMTATIKWTAKGGKVNPTTITWTGGTATTNPRFGSSYASGASAVAGSYADGPAQAFIVSDVIGSATCGTPRGMKKFKFTGLGGTSTFSIVSSPANTTEVFRDDFNGTTLDKTKWRPNWLGKTDAAISKPVNTAEETCYNPSQVSVGSGSLHLRAAAGPCSATNGVTYPYKSGLVQTRNHFTFTYGYMEARIFMPPGTGAVRNWPAFWANGTGVHPTTGELDVVEGLDGKACWHFHFSGGEPGACAPGSNHAGWHTYAADWRPGVVTFFYDGVQVGQITQGITSSPMYLILNLGISSTISGPVTVPSEMLVDYVRVTT